ncbi:GntR family transcriptional regulator [Listeria grandensis]|uniref:GntR family transcriptional regulator n=1 Tax=Listeria grandensis TaxID=1494963 RepID=UPI0016260524|nr:GntR family transcriptional regulator [Listeria grandensis]MBC1475612.1 GntR family transcriptional regulator [Listeria grandensis]
MMILNNERVADEIYASIKKDILCKKYKIGDTIEVKHLAALFGVSSNIAEQALRLLSQRGLLTQLPDDMYCVKETHSQEFFYSGRFQIMFLNMEYIIQRIKEMNVPIVKQPLYTHLEEMRVSLENASYTNYIDACERFYLKLCQQANMMSLGSSLRKINMQLTEFDDIFGRQFILTSAMCTVEAMGLLLDALEKREYDRATEVVQQLYKYYISLLTD